MNNVEVRYLGKETRPPFVIHYARGLKLRNVEAQPVSGASLFALKYVENMVIKDTRE